MNNISEADGKKGDSFLGCLFSGDHWDNTDELLLEELKKRVPVLFMKLEDQCYYRDIADNVKDCPVIFNYAVVEPVTGDALALTKTFELLGKKVLNSSHSLYYCEDKWMFYLHCVKHNLPVPETFLIPRIGYNREKISSLFEKSPLVLKASMSQSGSAVEKADNMEEFEKYWKKMAAGNPESSIVAQEYIADGNGNGDKYKSYRVLLAGGKILQAVAKYGKSWKITGYEDSEHFRQFDIDSDLKDICEKAAKVLGMDLCGVDLINKNGKWYIIEVNSNPGFDFIESDKKRLVSDVADYLADVFKATIVKK